MRTTRSARLSGSAPSAVIVSPGDRPVAGRAASRLDLTAPQALHGRHERPADGDDDHHFEPVAHQVVHPSSLAETGSMTTPEPPEPPVPDRARFLDLGRTTL